MAYNEQSFLLCWSSVFHPARYKSSFEKLMMKLITKAEYLMSSPGQVMIVVQTMRAYSLASIAESSMLGVR